MIAYHASNMKFNKFSMDYANTREHKEQFNALWFSTDKDYVKQYGKNLYKVSIKGNFIKEEQFKLAEKLSKEFCKINGIKDYKYYGMMLETQYGQAFADFLVKKGYDGYIFPQHKGKTIIVFNPDVVKIIDTLDERLEELEQGIYATQSAYDILNWLKNKPNAYRVVYDKNIRTYFICNAYNYIHQDMLEAAYRSGFYPELYSQGEVRDYTDEGMFNGELLFFAFSPDADKTLDHEKSSDGYTQKYTYDFGAIYSHEMTPLEDFDFYQLVGKPKNKEFIYEDFKTLNKFLENLI